ncbi:stress responsive a b barrel domain protein [Penicillium capsulatum]|uniref:Stress responsive a b barrel domain protein n=1 Tax=Penicillium capsulatum TaxID=69766 RepID=A0A9W9LVQ7_9EURO|nr:stress responsive a b barrel domain protein [Penicillium capsulatum]KAJ6123279.1 stress responsive a b barrel domain protein [Penicillium capsulatum]
MTFVHMVLLKFRAEVTQEHKTAFVKELKTLKNLACVKEGRLLVGGPSVTNPIERSKGFEYALVSYHETRAALDEYQYCKEHTQSVVSYPTPVQPPCS